MPATAPASKGRASGPQVISTLVAHWPEYAIEAALLGSFMISACVFGVLLEYPASPVRQALHSADFRRFLAGIAMGLTAAMIFYSPWGKRSGAHINPAVTLTFLRLGKVKPIDATFYVLAQCAGAVLGVVIPAVILRNGISHPAVAYAATVPGPRGPLAAWIAEFAIASLMMTTVLFFSSNEKISRFTGLTAAILVAVYITFEAPFSGMSINPARTLGSALPSGIWTSFWIYLTAPPLAMLAAAEFFLWQKGRKSVMCCKLQHDAAQRCIFCGANGGFKS